MGNLDMPCSSYRRAVDSWKGRDPAKTRLFCREAAQIATRDGVRSLSERVEKNAGFNNRWSANREPWAMVTKNGEM
jgi:hypothetical protein